jgi:hypothetical protein
MVTSGEDWYPSALDKRAEFHINLDNQAADFATKYGWKAEQLASIHADRVWYEYWYPAKLEIDAKNRQLTKYISTIGGNKTDVDAPATVDFTPSGAPPPEVAPGIEARTRELRRETVNKSVYAKADGVLLGFERAAAEGLNLSEYVADIASVRQLTAYRLEAVFAKKGVDAYRFEGRLKGGEWFHISDESSSPAILQLPAQAGGAAAQIELRAVGMSKYKSVGQYSAIMVATIAP